MRSINNIVLHCTATSQDAKPENILRYWKETLGWRTPGYHYLIEKDGAVNNLLPIEKPSNGVKGHNSDSIHISYIGGIDENGAPKDNRTPNQIQAQIDLLTKLKERFPDANICGHRDFPGVNKACPSFDVKQWLINIDFH